MLIAIDGRPFQGNITGVGRYVYEICTMLENAFTDATFHVYSNRPMSISPFSSRWHFRYETNAVLSKLPPPLWLKLFSARMINGDEASCFWGPAFFLPYGLNRNIKSLLTVHDINFLIAPETMTVMYRLFFRLFFRSGLRSADLISTNSHGTSNRLNEFFYRKADIVAPPSVNPNKFYRPNDKIIKSVIKKYDLKNPYFLSVSTLEPRKNLDVLIDAFELFTKNNPSKNCNLVLVGASGWKNNDILTRISNHPDIERLGFVPDADLPALYANAVSLIFPSKYEGFGMPVLEARLCGSPTIASDIDEIREAGGDNTIYVKPNASNIAREMKKVWEQRPEITQPNYLTWEESAKKIAIGLSNLI